MKVRKEVSIFMLVIAGALLLVSSVFWYWQSAMTLFIVSKVLVIISVGFLFLKR